MSPQQAAPNTLPADFFSAPDTLPANYFSQQAPATLPADYFAKQPARDPNDRLFTGAPGEIRAAQEPSVWDRITGLFNSRKPAEPGLGTSALTNAIGNAVPQAGVPALAAAKRYAVDPLDRAAQAGANTGRQIGREAVTGATMLSHAGDYLNASLPSPYGPKASVVSPEKLSEQEHPLAMGVAGGVGSVVGSTVADPRNWAFFGSSAARPVLQQLIARGFATQMSAQTYQGAKELYDKWDKLTPTQRAEIGTKTGVGALFAAKGIAEGQLHTVDPASPLGHVLAEPAPSVRVADNAAAARDLIEADTVRMTGPSGIAEMRNPSARVVNDGHIPVVSQDEVLAHSIAHVISNSAELRNAGVDVSAIKTTGDIDAALMRASDHIKSNLDPRAYNTLSFETQKGLAADLNMSVEQLLARREGQSFNTEEALAARALLNQSAQHVIELSKIAQSGDAAAVNAATTALAQHKAIQETVAGVRAEAGRALGGYRIDNASLPEVKITNILSKLSPKAQAQAIELLSRLDPADPQTVRRVNQFVEQVKPSTTLEKLHEAYRNSLLSSPHTLIVKTASELSMVAMEAMKKAVAGGIAKFKYSPDRFAAESWYYAKGMAQALAEHAKPILSGEFQLEGSPGFERAGSQAIKGALGSVVRSPSEAMSRATNLMYMGNYLGELNSLAARQSIAEGLSGDAFHARQEYLAHQPTEEMQEAAHDLATRNTFQNGLTGFSKKVGEAIAAKPNVSWLPESAKSVSPLKFLFPFFKTPVNLFKATITHATPYELLNGIAKGGDTDALARGIVGSSIAASLAALALSGHITGGGPIDFKKEETKRATGWQPYSIKIGDRYYSYHRFEPVGLAAGLIADAVHGATTGDSEVVSQSKADTAIKHIMRNLDDMPFMGTLANLLQAVHDPVGGRAQSFINREAGSLVPAGVANIAETIDPTVRRPQNALQAIESRIPGLTSAAPAIVDVTGQHVQRPFNNLGGANPFPFTTAKHDPVVDELARLGISTPQPPTQIKWKGKLTPLTDAERQQFAQAEGEELYKRVARVMQSGSWAKRTDDRKRKALVQLHDMIDQSRPARLTRMRKESQTELAGRSLRGTPATP